jgi:hypothetical protein
MFPLFRDHENDAAYSIPLLNVPPTLDEVLQPLVKLDSRQAKVVETHFFGGLRWKRPPKH